MQYVRGYHLVAQIKAELVHEIFGVPLRTGKEAQATSAKTSRRRVTRKFILDITRTRGTHTAACLKL